MPGVYKKEMKPNAPITQIATGISAFLMDTDRGIPNVPQMLTNLTQAINETGSYRSDRLSLYMAKGGFNNGAKTVWGIRVVGANALSAAGADDFKVSPSKAELVHGAADARILVQAQDEGVDGATVSLTIVANTTDVTEATLVGRDITMKLASVSAWKKIARIGEFVLDGYAHLVVGTVIDDSLCFYAKAAGVAGNSYSVEIIDSGLGGLTETYDALGLKLTIDLGGAAPTANAILAAVPAVGGLAAFKVGTGLVATPTAAEAHLTGGQSNIAALISTAYGGTGLSAMAIMSRTFLAGTGVGATGSDLFTDASLITSLTAVTDSVIPGDIFVCLNGVNKGAYEILEVLGENSLQLDRDLSTQANMLYAIYGTASRYGHVTGTLLSPGERGNSFSCRITKERSGTTLKAVLSVLDADGVTRTLETFTGLSPVPGNASFIDTYFAQNSRWCRVVANPGITVSSGLTGTSVGLDNNLEQVGASFLTDGVEAGDLVVISAATVAGDVRVYRVLSVVDEENLLLDSNIVGANAGTIEFTVVGEDHTGLELLSVVGTAGLTLTFGGGVDDVAKKADYEGDESTKTGVYAIRKINPALAPNKFTVLEEAIVVDGTGADATAQLRASMATFCETEKSMVYLSTAEFGLTPTTLAAAVTAEGFDSKYTAFYWPWGYVPDPVTGTARWVPLTAHMIGIYDKVDAGEEGMHKAPANVQMVDVYKLEYEASVGEGSECDALTELNVNCIVNFEGIRPYGARLMTADDGEMFIHKRLVAMRTAMSICRALATQFPFGVQAPDTWATIVQKIDGFCAQYDRRSHSNGCFLNKTDPSAKPWYIICDSSNNSLAGTTINIEHGFDIVDMVEKVIYTYGFNTSTGEFTVTQTA